MAELELESTSTQDSVATSCMSRWNQHMVPGQHKPKERWQQSPGQQTPREHELNPSPSGFTHVERTGYRAQFFNEASSVLRLSLGLLQGKTHLCPKSLSPVPGEMEAEGNEP